MIILHFPIKPKAIQSFKFTKKGHKYQPVDVKIFKAKIKAYAKSQYKGKPFNKLIPLRITVEFNFEFLKKHKIREKHYKVTKPDLTDNLLKGFIDALSGIIWEQDQQIASVRSDKYNNNNNEINLIVEEIK